MPNGKKCRAAALRNTPFCYFHTRVRGLARPKVKSKDQPLQLPILEDRAAIQLALAQVLDAFAATRIDHKQASLFLYGLQIASQNIPSRPPTLANDTVQSFTRTRDGHELAPEKLTCDPGDCKTCHARNRCIHYRLVTALSGGVHPAEDPDLNPRPAPLLRSDDHEYNKTRDGSG